MKSKLMIQIGLISLAMVLIGCGQSQQGRQTIQTQPGVQTPGGNGNPIYNPGSGTLGSEVQVQGANLQAAIEQLVAVNAEPTPVGPIGQTQGSGVFISTQISLSVGMQQALSAGGQINQNSSFNLRARDAYSGQPDPRTGGAIPDISVRISPEISGFRGASGMIQPGGRFQVVFADAYGQVMIDGQIQGQTVTGQVGFQNAGMQAIGIGQFSAPLCAMFRCQ